MKHYLNVVSERADVLSYDMRHIQTLSFGKADKAMATATPRDGGQYEIKPGDDLIRIRFLDDTEEWFRADKWSIYFSEEIPPEKWTKEV
ncbi:MAG: hypothetical protein LUE23_05310 [Lachnospiraceae bacterium]|nr:hypothetical protein [Lachnospiraceae bacterium]